MTQRFYHVQRCNNTFIEFNGKKVLYSLNIESEPARRMVIIAGYVVGEPCKDVPEENVVKVTDVEPITGLNERQDLSNLLREKERRNIFSFW